MVGLNEDRNLLVRRKSGVASPFRSSSKIAVQVNGHIRVNIGVDDLTFSLTSNSYKGCCQGRITEQGGRVFFSYGVLKYHNKGKVYNGNEPVI